ncbi:unnamed protein product [Ranitomeya imitator]|uniref:aspartate transaminase n=1 Tax=Ranitomeya imitator TaxID=111125 RepID=A0ABN9MMZ5_9NEOB|nr:unnamed protein product [Ranitomeya imitator]
MIVLRSSSNDCAPALAKPLTECVHKDVLRYRWIFESAGLTDIRPYRFWDNDNIGLALPEMLEDLERSPDFSIIMLPTSCNPTGIQLRSSDWKQIADVMRRKNMFPFFHLKDQGLGSGDVDVDAWPVRYFVSEDFELFCAQSFSASFGLYGAMIKDVTDRIPKLFSSKDVHPFLLIHVGTNDTARKDLPTICKDFEELGKKVKELDAQRRTTPQQTWETHIRQKTRYTHQEGVKLEEEGTGRKTLDSNKDDPGKHTQKGGKNISKTIHSEEIGTKQNPLNCMLANARSLTNKMEELEAEISTGERIGNLLIVMKSNEVLISVRSQLENLALEIWSMPPCLGSRVVATVLNNPSLYVEWKDSLKMTVRRLMIIREKIREKLRLLETLKSWEHITEQAGVFAFTGLNCQVISLITATVQQSCPNREGAGCVVQPAPEMNQVDTLAKEKHVYLPAHGQLNISGLNANNLDYVTQAIHDVTMNENEQISAKDLRSLTRLRAGDQLDP